MLRVSVLLLMLSLLGPLSALGIESAANSPNESSLVESPWLLTPTVSSDPKLGTSIGFLVGYMHKFDEASPTSMFGVAGTSNLNGSNMGGVFARTYFGGDLHRMIAMAGGGIVDNDYADFLGTGLPVSSTDNLKVFAMRYLHRIGNNWYLGGQLLDTNYAISGNDFFSQQVLDLIGLTGFDSVAVGAVAQYDSRNNQNSPAEGAYLTLFNNAYREALGGEESFDAYSADLRHYLTHGHELVLASRLSGRWTDGAPPGGLSSVGLRGYVRGQYLGRHVTSLELDERIPLTRSLGTSLYAGVAGLYGDLADLDHGDNWYPAIALGISFLVKKNEKMVVKLDFAVGKGNNQGVYLNFGHPF